MSRFFTTEIDTFGSLQLITVKSNALRKRADITVYQPEYSGPEKPLPLVILLHGVYGSHWAWAAKGKAPETLQRLMDAEQLSPMVLAMPSDGLFGDGSGYVPHQEADYEKWIVEDVIAVMQEQFPAIQTASPVFLAGLSMGGFGALRLGAKYPQVFRAFSGLSSITHFDQLQGFVSNFAELQQQALEQDGVWDWMLKNKAVLPPFRFDCGVDDSLLEPNQRLHQQLIAHQIPHTYQAFPGGHQWEYWAEHLEKTLLFFQQFVPEV